MNLSMLDHALLYANKKLPVFPVHTAMNNQCSCGNKNCDRIAKHPRTPNGFKDASTDESKIRGWWNEHPNANIGIETGEKSGLVVLDFDVKHDGFENFQEIEKKYAKIPSAPFVITGSGGGHVYFKHPGTPTKTATNLFAQDLQLEKTGIDIRADGGYIIAPPSLHSCNKRYSWDLVYNLEDIALPMMPEWLIALTRRVSKFSELADRAYNTGKISSGSRNDSLMRYCGYFLGKKVGNKIIFQSIHALNCLYCDPPLGSEEVDKILCSMISRYGGGYEA